MPITTDEAEKAAIRAGWFNDFKKDVTGSRVLLNEAKQAIQTKISANTSLVDRMNQDSFFTDAEKNEIIAYINVLTQIQTTLATIDI